MVLIQVQTKDCFLCGRKNATYEYFPEKKVLKKRRKEAGATDETSDGRPDMTDGEKHNALATDGKKHGTLAADGEKRVAANLLTVKLWDF